MNKADITPELVSRLLSAQFRHWAHLPLTPVELDGWDNTTFRLGTELAVRLPNADAYVPQVEKEHRWLPILAPQLPLPSRNPWRRAPLAPASRGDGRSTVGCPASRPPWIASPISTGSRPTPAAGVLP